MRRSNPGAKAIMYGVLLVKVKPYVAPLDCRAPLTVRVLRGARNL